MNSTNSADNIAVSSEVHMIEVSVDTFKILPLVSS